MLGIPSHAGHCAVASRCWVWSYSRFPMMCLLSLGELLRPTAVPLVLVYRRYQDIHPKSPLFLAVTAGQRQLAFTEGRCSPSFAWPGAVFFFSVCTAKGVFWMMLPGHFWTHPASAPAHTQDLSFQATDFKKWASNKFM